MKELFGIDTIVVFGLLLIAGLQDIALIVQIVAGVFAAIFALLKSIDIVRGWYRKESKD